MKKALADGTYSDEHYLMLVDAALQCIAEMGEEIDELTEQLKQKGKK